MPIDYLVQSLLNYEIAQKVHKKIFFKNEKNGIFSTFQVFMKNFYIQSCIFLTFCISRVF